MVKPLYIQIVALVAIFAGIALIYFPAALILTGAAVIYAVEREGKAAHIAAGLELLKTRKPQSERAA
jgi:hypothetical protein